MALGFGHEPLQDKAADAVALPFRRDVELKKIQYRTLGAGLDPADILALERDDADLLQDELAGEAHILPVLVPAEGFFDPVVHRRAVELTREAIVDRPSLPQRDLHELRSP